MISAQPVESNGPAFNKCRDDVMKRRDFLKASGLAAVGVLSRGVVAGERRRPNLLVIHTDEHNFRTLGCYRATMSPEQALMWGDAVVETPNIDWLAKAGAMCTSFYATTPVCSPSRAAFVSGRYPQNTPVTTNNIPLNDDIITFAEILRRKGYATGYAGKWHLDGPGKPQWGPKRQFGFADKTVDFISANKDKPFCYMVSIPDPRGPDTARQPYDTMYEQQKYNQPRTFDIEVTRRQKQYGPNQLREKKGRSLCSNTKVKIK